MSGHGQVIRPNSSTQELHNRKYQVFLKLLKHQYEYISIMHPESA